MGQRSSKYNYQKGELLGEGAFGQVYRATHRTTGVIVALKKLKIKTKEQRHSAKKELEPLSQLEHMSHPHIVKHVDCFVKGKSLWLVLEYCSQGTLNEFLLGQEPSKVVILRLMKEIADAVSFLHDNNIVHRDLKPDNILLTGNSQAPVVKVGDFGLAKVCGVGDDLLLEHYSIKSPCGTPFFLAPEVIKARKTGESYNMYCDVFSMGVIFVAMVERKQIAGKVVAYVSLTSWAFHGSTPIDIGLYLCNNPSSDLSKEILKGNMNRRFKQLVFSMLRHNYRDRPASSSVLEQLNTIMTLEPEPDPPVNKPKHPPVKKTEHPPASDNNRNNRRPIVKKSSPPERRHQNVRPAQNNQDHVPVLVGGAGTAGAVWGAVVGGPLGAAAGGMVGATAGLIFGAITAR